MKTHLKRTINFGKTVTRACSYEATAGTNTVDKKIFDALKDEAKCKHCVRESQRKWQSSLT